MYNDNICVNTVYDVQISNMLVMLASQVLIVKFSILLVSPMNENFSILKFPKLRYIRNDNI